MASLLDLENPEKWQTRDSQFFSVAPKNKLPEYTSSVSFTTNVICILVDNSEAKETWNFAGWVSQKINLPVGPVSIPAKVNDCRLWLRRKQLLIFPIDVPSYQIAIKFPPWFTQVSVTVWEYQA